MTPLFIPNGIMVTIRCATYNHEPYIRQCLEGFVMQKTNFLFEAVVHDDASTDKTADIIREFATKYPEIIKPIYQTENQYSKHDGSLTRIMNAHTRGKYIALCEGDDYWTDPLKLQKQVDLLEANPEYSMCFTNAEVLYDGIVAPKSGTSIYNHLQSKEYSGTDILKKWTVPTASVVFRNYFNEGKVMPWDNRFFFGDIVLFLWLAEFGKLWCINEKTVVYRRNSKGVTFGKYDYKKRVNHYLAIREHFGAKYEKNTKILIAKNYVGCFISGKLDILSFQVLKDLLKDSKYLPLFLALLPSHLVKSISRKIKSIFT